MLAMSEKLLKTIYVAIEQHSYLRICIDHHLSWNPQIEYYVCSNAVKYIGKLPTTYIIYKIAQKNSKKNNYEQFVLASYQLQLQNMLPQFGKLYRSIDKIEMVQHRAAHFVLGHPWRKKQEIV